MRSFRGERTSLFERTTQLTRTELRRKIVQTPALYNPNFTTLPGF